MKKILVYSALTFLCMICILSFILSCIKHNSYELPEVTSNDIVQQIPQSTPWNLILVNSALPLPENYSLSLAELRNGHAVDERIYPDLQAMMDAARAEGLNPLICSSYRSLEKQESLFENKVSEYLSHAYSQEEAEIEAAKWVAKPGTSEHHTGLAVDIVSMDYQLLDEAQETTPEQQWLLQNAHNYGFILRYPNNKSEITGIYYEPWHYRYVGKDVASEIYTQELCLEEYLQNLQK